MSDKFAVCVYDQCFSYARSTMKNARLADVTGKLLLTRTSSDAAISMMPGLSGYPAGNYTVTQGTQTMSRVIVFGGK